MDIYYIIELALSKNASDIHITENEYIRFRINGDIVFENIFIDSIKTNEIKLKILTDIEIDKLKALKEIDKAIEYKENRFRFHIYLQNTGVSFAIRIISMNIPTIEELYLPKNLYSINEIKSGLVIITGSTGSGKTTTLASLVEYINQNKNKHIVTIENPIEYIYKSKSSLVNQREIYSDVINFERAIKSVVRQDPDIIVLGEMRSNESIKSAITLAELGHLVITTLHSRTILDTVSRIIDVFSDTEKNQIRTQLSNSLKLVVNQELVKYNDKRYPICEIMTVNNAIKNIIKENRNLSAIMDQMIINKKENLLKSDSIHNIEKLI